MDIKKDLLIHVLSTLADVFPSSVKDWEKLRNEVGEALDLTGYLVYLKDHGYLVGGMTFTPLSSGHPWQVDLPTIRITASGLDYLQELKSEDNKNVSGGGWILRSRRS